MPRRSARLSMNSGFGQVTREQAGLLGSIRPQAVTANAYHQANQQLPLMKDDSILNAALQSATHAGKPSQ